MDTQFTLWVVMSWFESKVWQSISYLCYYQQCSLVNTSKYGTILLESPDKTAVGTHSVPMYWRDKSNLHENRLGLSA